MKRIRDLEALFLRAEAGAAVFLVLLMLTLASYNVVYRNVLVPIQRHYAHSGPPIEHPEPAAPIGDRKVADAKGEATPDDKAGAEGFAGDFGGGADEAGDEGLDEFAGDFGGDDDEGGEADAKADAKSDAKSGAEGFGGDFGGGDDDGAGDDFGGFGGLGAAAATGGAPSEEDLSFDSEGEVRNEFDNLAKIEAADPDADTGPKGGPPPPGSFAAWVVKFVDDIKLDWIDILLRQLVIIVSFFGATLATQRGKHINIDALSKVLSPAARRWVAVLVNVVAISVCLILASAGMDLVKIGQEFPKDLMPWALEWHFQLMFPIGFSLVALHFVVRLAEGLTGGVPTDDKAAHSAIAEPLEPPDEVDDPDPLPRHERPTREYDHARGDFVDRLGAAEDSDDPLASDDDGAEGDLAPDDAPPPDEPADEPADEPSDDDDDDAKGGA
jgi:TRAP-type C4-dicarboxylate transport system permease small subunit